MSERQRRSTDKLPGWGTRALLLAALLKTAPGCDNEGPEEPTVVSTGETTGNPNPSSGGDTTGGIEGTEGSTTETKESSTGETDTGSTANPGSITGEATGTTGGSDTSQTGVDTESHEPLSPPTIDEMPVEGNVMPFFSELIKVTGGCEAVEEVQWSYVLEKDEVNWDWNNDNNWKNVTYVEGATEWELKTNLAIGTYRVCFRTAKNGVKSPNDAACFRLERIV